MNNIVLLLKLGFLATFASILCLDMEISNAVQEAARSLTSHLPANRRYHKAAQRLCLEKLSHMSWFNDSAGHVLCTRCEFYYTSLFDFFVHAC
jgi:hypothetical protein